MLFLKEKSKKFYHNAIYLFEKGDYDLASFNMEQSCQLLVKYFLAKKMGEWPKTHYLVQLIKMLSEAYESKEIHDYLKENELFFDDLSDAYFTSRYFPKEFSKNLLEKLIDNYKNFIKFLEERMNEPLDFGL
jgi:HEPN domain-containing protein